MQLSNKLEERKKDIITSLMLSVKSFNEKHRAIAAVTTFFALLLIVILSALFSVTIFVCSLFEKTTSTGKRIAGIVLAGVLLCAVIFAAHKLIGPKTPKSGIEAAITEDQGKEPEASGQGQEQEIVDTVVEQPSAEETTAPIAGSAESTSTETNTTAETAATATTTATTTTATTTTPGKSWDTADIELDKLMEAYPEMVGWVYFEDGHISYPIMQAENNEKYSKLDYTGEEAPTGAIFLDYRSAADFADANSIVYGHNMKDGTMFGSLREYRKDPAYYNDHMYFQIITPKKAYRYLIFEYMDVPEDYVLYDYVSDAALEFVKDAEHVRIKSYMDSEIPVTKDSKVVTLSTCTKKDDLQFVVLGVLVEESDN